MSETITEREYSEAELRAAGASALFIAYYKTAPPDASARREIERGPFSMEKLNESPHLGGGFFQSLWNGDENRAFGRADSNNLRILEEATGKRKKTALGW